MDQTQAVNEYFAAVREERQKLDAANPEGFVHVMSLRNVLKGSRPGVVTEVTTAIAARHIVDQTARVAKGEEVVAFKKQGEEFAVKMAAQDQGRDKSRNLVKALVEEIKNQPQRSGK